MDFMRKTILLFLFCFYSLFAHGSDIAFDPQLQMELLEMSENDQAVRMELIHTVDAKARAELIQKATEIDDFHSIRLKEIIALYGWPGYSRVGPEGSQAFWLLVQHTPDLLFQSQCLEFLEDAVLNHEASPIHLAYLKDRVYVRAGKNQIYGTQVKEDLTFHPIEDEEHVDERRAAIGLPPLEEYLKELKAFHGS